MFKENTKLNSKDLSRKSTNEIIDVIFPIIRDNTTLTSISIDIFGTIVSSENNGLVKEITLRNKKISNPTIGTQVANHHSNCFSNFKN